MHEKTRGNYHGKWFFVPVLFWGYQPCFVGYCACPVLGAIDNQPFFLRRYSPGEIPIIFLNILEK